jgi:hypothetical protein
MNRATDVFFAIAPFVSTVLIIVRWIDAFRLSTNVELPLPLPWRVLLARYNLLVVSTYIYRGLLALKKPTPNGSGPGKENGV